MGWFKLSFFYTFLSTLVATSFAANCYSPDGSDRNLHSDVAEGTVLYTPCSQVTRFSMCCRQPNDGGDDCRSDGLCQGYATDGSLPIWRESCTDRSWQSPYCLNLCTTGINEDGNDSTYIFASLIGPEEEIGTHRIMRTQTTPAILS